MKKISNFRFTWKEIILLFISFFVLSSVAIISSRNVEQNDLVETVNENQIEIGDKSFILPQLKGFSSAEQRGMKDYIKSISVSKHHWPTIYTYYNEYKSFNCVSFHSLSKFTWIAMTEKKAEKSLKEIFPRSKVKSIKYRDAIIFYSDKQSAKWFGLFFKDGLILIRNSKGYIDRNDLFDLTLKFIEKNA
jgi:hypothetical protein